MTTDSVLSDESRLVTFVVDGVPFELDASLIEKRVPRSLLAHEGRLARFYNAERKAYAFDQSADAFEVLVYFISTGLLTRPSHVASRTLHGLLAFFEVDETLMRTYERMEHLACETYWDKAHEFVSLDARCVDDERRSFQIGKCVDTLVLCRTVVIQSHDHQPLLLRHHHDLLRQSRFRVHLRSSTIAFIPVGNGYDSHRC